MLPYLILITSISINPVAIKNKELREYIIGKMILNMLHTIEQMILPLKDALNLIKRFKARPYHGKKHSVMQAEKKVFTIENSPIFNEDGTLEVNRFQCRRHGD
jgi:hypothetical protein